MECDPFAPHVESFNYFIDNLNAAVKDIPPEEFRHPDGGIMKLEYTGASLAVPSLANEGAQAEALKIYPVECRQRGLTYAGKLTCNFAVSSNNIRLVEDVPKTLGDIPIMVQSTLCNLHGMTGKQLVAKCEEETEKGGFFIVKGLDKVLRLLVNMRQNYPMALIRDSWLKRGPAFSKYGIMIRCVKGNHTTVVHSLHYMHTKRIVFFVNVNKQRFMIPVGFLLKGFLPNNQRQTLTIRFLKALSSNVRDSEVFEELTDGMPCDDEWFGCIENIIEDAAKHVGTVNAVLSHFGILFRHVLMLPDFFMDAEVGRKFLDRCVFIHLNTDEEKLKFLIYSIRKLISLVKEEIKDESTDNPVFQEVALPGHTFLMIMKERLKVYLRKVRFYIGEQLLRLGPGRYVISEVLEQAFQKATGKDIQRSFEYFLATGNLVSSGEVVLPQSNGFSIVAERINHFRYISHFRGIHRGAVFQDMRTTDVRKLRPEAWGFICPVHTPDGSPCGLLNHLAAGCTVTCSDGPTEALIQVLHSAGFFDLNEDDFVLENVHELYPVFLNGKIIGYLTDVTAPKAALALRRAKVMSLNEKKISRFTEIVLVPKMEFRNLAPALHIFTNSGRMMRPVRNLEIVDENGEPVLEFIGCFEQIYMNIAVVPKEFEKGVTTHMELSPSAMLSYIANLIPYPDHNQSPRNVYQCQMSKQTLGSMIHSLQHRADNKMYRLLTPQTPLVKPAAYDIYDIDRYPLGTNAIVAVIAYTGYDMEDGMVINKASYDRGFATGCVYKCERADLRAVRGSRRDQYVFARNPEDQYVAQFLDEDGLPIIGRKYVEGDPLYSYMDVNEGSYKIKRYKNVEVCYVDNVKICGNETGNELLNHVVIMLRSTRKPNIGDKFASRHGQKGICSFLWPVENMPFTESGMVPDIIFNPHGFPSRMTVGMMIESMAGKSAASHGVKHDATPFQFGEENPALQYFGECLQKAGYNYLGNEPLYSGIDGREFEAHIFFGLVYYQRLRHMVADKFQVRASGAMDPLTKQPVKGRKKGGGVRFGEMERDAIISHGGAAVIHERLFLSSDRDSAHVCTRCGSYVSIMLQIPGESERIDPVMQAKACGYTNIEYDCVAEADMPLDGYDQRSRIPYCRACRSSYYVTMIPLPHVFKYFMAELVSVGIKTKFKVIGGD